MLDGCIYAREETEHLRTCLLGNACLYFVDRWILKEKKHTLRTLRGGNYSVAGVCSERSGHAAWCEDSREKREACRIGEPCFGDNMVYVLFGEAV